MRPYSYDEIALWSERHQTLFRKMKEFFAEDITFELLDKELIDLTTESVVSRIRLLERRNRDQREGIRLPKND